MKRIFLFLTVLLLSTCAIIAKQKETISAKFIGQTPRMGSFVPPGEMSLSLNTDGTFNLFWLQVSYTGRWKLLEKKCILLRFDEITDPAVFLRSGTISDKETVMKYITKNKVKIWNYVLKIENILKK